MNRRQLITIWVVTALVLTGCAKHYIHVFDVASLAPSIKNDQWMIQEDSVTVTYSFYAMHGVMAFSVLNNSSKPIYIDWAHSSFIINNARNRYWTEDVTTETAGSASTYMVTTVNPAWFKWGTQGFFDSETNSYSVTKHEERVSFIPPNAYMNFAKYMLYPADAYPFNSQATTSMVPMTDKPGVTTEIKRCAFASVDSPIRFRNFLSISNHENGDGARHLDHAFWVSAITEMDLRHFRGAMVDHGGEQLVYRRPFSTPKVFYTKP